MKRASDKPSGDDTSGSGVLIGYARVSTDEQDVAMQVAALKRAGVDDDHLHVEYVSGVSAKRPMLELALMDARPGDTFVVWRLDRMGRSLIDLLNKLASLEERGIKFRSLTERIDLSTASGWLAAVNTAMFAEFERRLTIERTKSGQDRARAEGKQIGHAPKIDVAKAEAMLARGMSGTEVARHFKVYPSAVYSKWNASAVQMLRDKYEQEQEAKREARREARAKAKRKQR